MAHNVRAPFPFFVIILSSPSTDEGSLRAVSLCCFPVLFPCAVSLCCFPVLFPRALSPCCHSEGRLTGPKNLSFALSCAVIPSNARDLLFAFAFCSLRPFVLAGAPPFDL